MNLVKANISIPDKVAEQLESEALNHLCNNIQEYVEEAIEDLACVQWDKDLKVTFG